MTDRTPAQTLRAAAEKLHEATKGTTPGAWTHDPDRIWNASPHFDQEFVGTPGQYDGTLIIAATGRPEDSESLANADWIALMQPSVGLVLAQWLDTTATYYRPGVTHPSHVTAALAVARRLLGEVTE